MRIHEKNLLVLLLCFVTFSSIQAQFQYNYPLIDSVCVDSYGNFNTVAPQILMPETYPTDANGNYVFCPDGSWDGLFPINPINGSLPNNDFLIQYSNGAIGATEDGTWDSMEADLAFGDTVYLFAGTYDLDSVNSALDFATTLCPLLDIIFPDIQPCNLVDTLVNGYNDGEPGLNSISEVVLFAGSLGGNPNVTTVDSVIAAFYEINTSINDFGVSVCFGISEPVVIIATEDCSSIELFGCTDPLACNYFESATQDDGSCINIGDSCDDNNEYTINDVYISDCLCEGTLNTQIFGCIDSTACNYNASANEDDGTCVYVADMCDDNNPDTFNDVYLSDCSCAGIVQVLGCVDSTACNYDVSANTDDGSCLTTGDICDDMDANTTGDIYNEDCECMGVVGIETFDMQNFISIDKMYPLPIKETLNISIATSSVNKLNIKIFNVDGQLLKSKRISPNYENNEITINTKDLTNGIYFLELSNDNFTIIEKILK